MAKKSPFTYYEGIGRRKSSTARVRLYVTTGKKEIVLRETKIKKGDIIVNGKTIEDYLQSNLANYRYNLPLELTDSTARFAISIVLSGGGKIGQLDAIVLGLARALEKVDGNNRTTLKTHGLLTRDSRERERRKPGMGGKARRKKQSPKR